MKFLATSLLSLLLLIPGAALNAQIQGTQDFVNLTGDQDKASRIAGFQFNNQYWIAYNDNSHGLSGGEGPGLYYAGFTASAATPPVLTFQNPSKIAIPGVPLNTHLCHMAAALLGGSPYIFQFKCKRSGAPDLVNATYEKLIAPVAPATTPTFSTLGKVSSSIESQAGNVFDVAAATLRSKMYLFLMRSTASKPDSIMVWSYAGQGSSGPVVESSFSFAGTDSTLQAIDATNVTLASGEQAIVVTATFVASGVAQVKAWLFDGTTTTLNPISLSNPPYAEFPASVRLAYGPAQGTAKINSCTIFYAAVDHGFFGNSSRIYQSQLALPASLQSPLTQSGSWSRLTGIWQNSRNGQFSQYPYAWTAFPVSIPAPAATNSAANVYQSLALVECGLSSDPHVHHDSIVSSPALLLKADSATGETANSANWTILNAADQKAAVQSWNLLGVITGLPPLPAGTTVNNRAPILSLSYSSTAATQTSTTTVVSDNVSAEVPDIGASAGYTYSTRQGYSATSSQTLNLGISFNASVTDNTFALEQDLGFLVVAQPVFRTDHYQVFAYDGTTPLGVGTVAISVKSTSIATIPFYLDHPATPYPNMPASIYQSFPTDAQGELVTYPMMTDIEGWKTPDTLTEVQPLFNNGVGQQYLSCVDYQVTTFGLTSTQLNAYSGQTSNKIEVGEGISFFGIDASVSNTFTLKSQTTVAFSSSQTSQIVYPELEPSMGYTAIQLHVIFDRLADTPTTTPNWMPTIFTGSKPWLLTWKVDSADPTTTTGTDGGSTPPSGCDNDPHKKPNPPAPHHNRRR